MRKILSILLALGLVLSMTVLATVPVGAVSNVQIEIDPDVECEAANWTITFDSSQPMSPGDKISITFPAGTDLSGASVTSVTYDPDGTPAAILWTNEYYINSTLHVGVNANVLAGKIEVEVGGVGNPPAGTYKVGVQTIWQHGIVWSDTFTIKAGASIDPDEVLWCPGKDVTTNIIWNASKSVAAIYYLGSDIGGGYWDEDDDVLTISNDYFVAVGFNYCMTFDLEIEFDVGCNATLTVSVIAAGTVVLEEGWNLMSLPIIPLDTAIAAVLADMDEVESVWYWDACTKEWYVYGANSSFKSLTKMEDGKAYWVKMAADETMEYCGYTFPKPPGVPPKYCYCVCWNMVGITSTADVDFDVYLASTPDGQPIYVVTWTQAGGWDTVSSGEDFVSGQGYFMAFTQATSITPPPPA